MSKKTEKSVKGKIKREAAKQVRKSSSKILCFLPLKYLILIILLLFGITVGSTFIPEKMVPPALEKVHSFLLTKRNKLMRESGLPFSYYEDTWIIENPGSDPIKIYLAPSPKIAPAVCAFIRSAIHTVDLCAFDIKLEGVADALIDAKNSGVQVRVVTETDYLTNEALDKIMKAEIPVKSDHRSGLMHNKFIIVDSRYLWTGSFNLTPHGKNRNDNNAILIESPSVAEGYKARFEQYWNEHFGKSGKPSAASAGYIGQMPVRYAFSPVDHVSEIILQELSRAKHTVDVMAFSFTSADIADKLCELHKKKVAIRCLFDYGQSKNKASKDEYLQKSGIKVYRSPNRKGKMHHKVFIIDGKTVVTGSFNFSKNAEKQNDENILVLRSEKIAEIYTDEMNRCIKGIKGY